MAGHFGTQAFGAPIDCEEQACEKWTLTNSLFLEKNSLLGLQKFPVPLRREFRWKSLNSLDDWTPKLLQSA